MSWKTCKIVRECKECKAVLCPGDTVWLQPRRVGLLSLISRKRGVLEQAAIHCEDCGKILEYER